jgi:deoxyribodipyrimidine photo-lyase
MNIWWIRKDLRITDNQALISALNQGAGVLPVFILDEHLLKASNENRQAFLISGLRKLDEDLRRLGSRLIVRSGDPLVEIPRLVNESGADCVFAEEDVTPYARRRDASMAKQVNLRLNGGLTIHPPTAVVKSDGQPYTIFTPFSHFWKSLPLGEQTLSVPVNLPLVPDIPSILLPNPSPSEFFPAGEYEAQRRLDDFLKGPIFEYAEGRNRLDQEGTSALSPYLHFGMLAARQAYAASRHAEETAPDARTRTGCETWQNELIWREFYQSILFHFPFVLKTAFRPSMRNITWRNSESDLKAWQNGRTGYPVVDAGMRQMAATGWMHNRARMITASFLVKHLLINWQEGERWFMQSLVDGDLAANNGGWQWVAGTGTDAAPYYRIFNPILQGKKYDPEGRYVRKWVPELADVPTRLIHTPWQMTLEEQSRFGVIIGRHYPAPIVEHDFARRRALKVYAR